MFTGKGGVGKTTCSAATAIHQASSGKTLVLSTDITPSLYHIFELSPGDKPQNPVPGLNVREIGEREVREMWENKFGREVHEVFSSFVDIDYESFAEFMTSILPGLGEEFMVDYIRETARRNEYDSIIWDTAPLGQTLGLLQTPALLAEHLKLAPRVYSKLKIGRRSRQPVLDILRRWGTLSDENMEFLRNEVDFTMVTIAEALAVEQLEGVFREMGRYGLRIGRIIVNNVVREPDSAFLETKAGQQRPYLEHIRSRYSHLEVLEVPLFPREVKGLARLKEVANIIFPDSPDSDGR